MKREKDISLMIWKLGDPDLASKLWGGYRIAGKEEGTFEELWEKRGYYRRNYIFFSGETREFAGCVSLHGINEIRRIYEVTFSIREEFKDCSKTIYKKLTGHLLEEAGVFMLIKPGEGSEELREAGFTPLAKGNYAGFSLEEPSYIIKKKAEL